MRTIPLPEPAMPVTVEMGCESPWRLAAERRNWRERADALDDLLIDQLAGTIANDGDVRAAAGLALLAMTAAAEQIGDTQIRSVDAALCYIMTVHGEWRAAARAFLEKNAVDLQAALRARPGFRLIHTVARARGTLLASNEAAAQAVH